MNMRLLKSIFMLVIFVLIGIAVYFFVTKNPMSPAENDQEANYTPEGFVLTTEISGPLCKVSVCKNIDQCIDLYGSTNEDNSCTLDKEQASKAGQDIMNILNTHE